MRFSKINMRVFANFICIHCFINYLFQFHILKFISLYYSFHFRLFYYRLSYFRFIYLNYLNISLLKIFNIIIIFFFQIVILLKTFISHYHTRVSLFVIKDFKSFI